ncbi:hypothetical protein BDQ12DRAFT_200854 [Crucibulum laeve]|uniref:Uncharacterized protein n=1 Tax=Crucibulum laeve TaxID=68775 RepID=A0A5C3MRJ1_9AGAR|nr:hypothetical protein BDQ12DRAFT_200854 [Crucibulum laeve]
MGTGIIDRLEISRQVVGVTDILWWLYSCVFQLKRGEISIAYAMCECRCKPRRFSENAGYLTEIAMLKDLGALLTIYNFYSCSLFNVDHTRYRYRTSDIVYREASLHSMLLRSRNHNTLVGSSIRLELTIMGPSVAL